MIFLAFSIYAVAFFPPGEIHYLAMIITSRLQEVVLIKSLKSEVKSLTTFSYKNRLVLWKPCKVVVFSLVDTDFFSAVLNDIVYVNSTSHKSIYKPSLIN